MKQSTYLANEAIERMVLSLEPKHWQAFAAEMRISYPYALSEKMKILREIIKNFGRKEAEDV
ncbi:MAG: hypothetical protein NC920_03725 [Candidatus Omnitrophica bacterium]|nr:hypothetical protein [Candidatus Omnitrophota bacterium]